MSEPERPEPTVISMAIQIDPFLMSHGYPFAGDVQALAEQMTEYIGKRVSERFTAEHPDVGLFVATVVKRGEETGSFQYREGHFVKDEPVKEETDG